MNVPTVAVAKVERLYDFEVQLQKVEFVLFISQQPLRVAAYYEGSGPKVYVLDVIIKL